MRITVKLIATYRKLLPEGTVGNKTQIDVSEGTSVADVLSQFGVPLDDSTAIALNGFTTLPLSTLVKDGDEVAAFNAVAGG
jgi:sulfur carrier protein ThiS